MSTFVLVHGSWHAGWCWHKIAARLERAGHRALAPDLPGHGRDRRPLAGITLADYVQCVTDVLDRESEPVILVGHSRGGIVISQAAEARPDKVRALVYLAAFLVPDGGTALELALADRDSLVLPNLHLDRAGGFDMLAERAYREALYADCSDDDIALARSLLTPEPSAPAATPLRLSDANYGRVPRTYIELTQDRAVSISLQRRMHQRLPCRTVRSLHTSHSAYFSAPDELTTHLLETAAL